jgi:hypothetical protein
LLQAGTGELGYLDGNRFQAVAFCPGFVRGLAFVGDCAVVGLSRVRTRSSSGLPLEGTLAARGLDSQCGLAVIDLRSGALIHGLWLDGIVEELFDVVVLPGVQRPRAIGLQADDIDRLVNFPGSSGLVATQPTVRRPPRGPAAPRAGLPRPASAPGPGTDGDGMATPETAPPLRYQRVFHLQPGNLAPYAHLLQPGLLAQWQTEAPRGELLAVSASADGRMVGLAIAEALPDPDAAGPRARLVSMKVSSGWLDQGIETTLVRHLLGA